MRTDEATAALHDCFECTDWQMFRDAASQDNNILESYTSSMTSYISKCANDVRKYKDSKIIPQQECIHEWRGGSSFKSQQRCLSVGDKEAYNATTKTEGWHERNKEEIWAETWGTATPAAVKICGRWFKMSQATKAEVSPSCVRPHCRMS